MSVFLQDQRVWIKMDPRTWEYNYAFTDGKSYGNSVSWELGAVATKPEPVARVRIVKLGVWAIDLPRYPDNRALHTWTHFNGWTTITTVPTYEEATGIAQILVATKGKQS